MGADKTLYLTREITDAEMEEIFKTLGMNFSRQSWGYSSELDVSPSGEEIHLHYGYWGSDHAKNAMRRTKQIIKELRKKGLLKRIGRWGY